VAAKNVYLPPPPGAPPRTRGVCQLFQHPHPQRCCSCVLPAAEAAGGGGGAAAGAVGQQQQQGQQLPDALQQALSALEALEASASPVASASPMAHTTAGGSSARAPPPTGSWPCQLQQLESLEAAAACSLPADNGSASTSSAASSASSASLQQLQRRDVQDLGRLALRLYLPRPWLPDLGGLQACQRLAQQLPSAAKLFAGSCLEGELPARLLLQSHYFTPAIRAAYQLLAHVAGPGVAEPPGSGSSSSGEQQQRWQELASGDSEAFSLGALGRLAEVCCSSKLQALQQEVLELALPYIASLLQEGFRLASGPAAAAAAAAEEGAAGSAAGQELLQHCQQVLLGLLPCLSAAELQTHVVPLLRQVLAQDTSAANERARLLVLQPQLHLLLVQHLPLQQYQAHLLPLLLSAALEHQPGSAAAPAPAAEAAAAGAELQAAQLPPVPQVAAAALATVARQVGVWAMPTPPCATCLELLPRQLAWAACAQLLLAARQPTLPATTRRCRCPWQWTTCWPRCCWRCRCQQRPQRRCRRWRQPCRRTPCRRCWWSRCCACAPWRGPARCPGELAAAAATARTVTPGLQQRQQV
jgi:hypothetical protein